LFPESWITNSPEAFSLSLNASDNGQGHGSQ
jgi:hypothetical protein